MKKWMIVSLVVFVFLLSGCSVSVDTEVSKADQFTAVAEDIEATFLEAQSMFIELSKKQKLSSSDQKSVYLQIEQLREGIKTFKSTEAPFLAKTAKKTVAKELNKIEKTLIKIQEKAKNGEVEKEDLELMIELISTDIEINFFD